MKKRKTKTDWGSVAKWYKGSVERKDSYQATVILPNLSRLLNIKPSEKLLDLACGEGFFSQHFSRKGAKVVGVDLGTPLVELARKKVPEATFYTGDATNLKFLKTTDFDKAIIVLALQNIEDAAKALSQCARKLKPAGELHIVLNHPVFRVPKYSSWGFTQDSSIQYRRIDRYLSESKEKIHMHPGEKPDEVTYSFHRPLQYYIKALVKSGFSVTGLEEWTSQKVSVAGPRKLAEDRGRKEIPLFLYIKARK